MSYHVIICRILVFSFRDMQTLELSSTCSNRTPRIWRFLKMIFWTQLWQRPFCLTVHSDHFRSILHFGRAGHSQRGQGQYRSQLCSLGSVAGSPALGITCEKLVGGTSVWCKPRWPRWRYLLDLPGGCLGICNARCVFSHQRFAIAMVRLDWICTSFVDSVWGNGYSGSLKQKLTASSAVLFLNDASSSTPELWIQNFMQAARAP